LFAALLACCLQVVHTPPVLAQQTQVKSKIELELEKKNNPAPNPTATSKSPRKGTPRSTRPSQPFEYSVSFISDVAGADVLLDGNLIGKTGEDKRLNVKVKKGQHKATASLKGYNPSTTTIGVFSDHMIYMLYLGKPLPPPSPAPTPASAAEPTPEPKPAEPVVNTDDVLKRFTDPSATNQLTANDWRALRSQTEEALAEKPGNPQLSARLHLSKGQLAYLDKNYAESLTEFNRAIVFLPLSGTSYYGLGNAYLATNQPVQAMKAYQQAMQLTPELSAMALKGIGDSFVQMDKPKEASAYYLRSRERGNLSAEINKAMAASFIKLRHWNKALAELSPIEKDDTTGEIHLYLGECYENLNRPLSAFRAYETATKLAPNSPLAFSKLGTLLFEQNEFPEAREALERALALDISGNIINRQQLRKLADNAASLAK
jgi:tetratricopeptide (TPR) repeat protein